MKHAWDVDVIWAVKVIQQTGKITSEKEENVTLLIVLDFSAALNLPDHLDHFQWPSSQSWHWNSPGSFSHCLLPLCEDHWGNPSGYFHAWVQSHFVAFLGSTPHNSIRARKSILAQLGLTPYIPVYIHFLDTLLCCFPCHCSASPGKAVASSIPLAWRLPTPLLLLRDSRAFPCCTRMPFDCLTLLLFPGTMRNSG